MTAIREFIKVKDHKITIDLPKDFNYKEVEVVILPKVDDDLSFLESEIQKGIESGISKKTHKEIFANLKSKYA